MVTLLIAAKASPKHIQNANNFKLSIKNVKFLHFKKGSVPFITAYEQDKSKLLQALSIKSLMDIIKKVLHKLKE